MDQEQFNKIKQMEDTPEMAHEIFGDLVKELHSVADFLRDSMGFSAAEIVGAMSSTVTVSMLTWYSENG